LDTDDQGTIILQRVNKEKLNFVMPKGAELCKTQKLIPLLLLANGLDCAGYSNEPHRMLFAMGVVLNIQNPEFQGRGNVFKKF